jgi:hypothetical protein
MWYLQQCSFCSGLFGHLGSFVLPYEF